MRTLTVLLSMMALALLCVTESHSQIDEFVCGTVWDEKDPQQQIDLSQLGGIYLTSLGQLNVLLVFVSFPDDNNPHPWWPVGQPPDSVEHWIDPDPQTERQNLANVTNYFSQMSMGLFNVVGEAIWVTAPHPYSYYGTNYGLANREALRDSVDPRIDFQQYDNWEYIRNYVHENRPDDKVDMIIMVYRGRPGGWYLGEASLGGGSTLYVDDKQIEFYGAPFGSGVTCTWPSTYSKKQALHIMVHEVGHWLLGFGHPYGYTSGGYAFWAMMGGPWPHGMCANSFERERLAWIDVDSIYITQNYSLSDFITTGDAYKYHPPNGLPDEFYYFENHQKLSIYDDATTNASDKGIWIVHQRNPYYDNHALRIKPAFGFWNWSTPNYNSACFPGFTLGEFQTASVARTSGKSNRQELQRNDSNWEWPHVYRDKQNVVWCGGFFRGDAPFLGTYNEIQERVFSPWSNPTTHTWDGSQTSFAMEVLNQSGNVINVKFHVTNPENVPPSKPQDHRVTVYNTGDNAHPRLTWAPNLEPDLAGYEIWRRHGYASQLPPWSLLTTVGSSTSEYIDYGINYAGSGGYIARYKIRAKDTTNKYSVFSDSGQVAYGNVWKAGQGDIPNETPAEYQIVQNYPNPFNPSTTIRYALPVDTYVVLKIYNMLGQEVATLVKGKQQAGWAEVSFDASGLATGIYLYRLQADRFVETKKMLLTK